MLVQELGFKVCPTEIRHGRSRAVRTPMGRDPNQGDLPEEVPSLSFSESRSVDWIRTTVYDEMI